MAVCKKFVGALCIAIFIQTANSYYKKAEREFEISNYWFNYWADYMFNYFDNDKDDYGDDYYYLNGHNYNRNNYYKNYYYEAPNRDWNKARGEDVFNNVPKLVKNIFEQICAIFTSTNDAKNACINHWNQWSNDDTLGSSQHSERNQCRTPIVQADVIPGGTYQYDWNTEAWGAANLKIQQLSTTFADKLRIAVEKKQNKAKGGGAANNACKSAYNKLRAGIINLNNNRVAHNDNDPVWVDQPIIAKYLSSGNRRQKQNLVDKVRNAMIAAINELPTQIATAANTLLKEKGEEYKNLCDITYGRVD